MIGGAGGGGAGGCVEVLCRDRRLVWEFSRGVVHSAFATYKHIGGLLVRGAGICAAVVVRNQALEEFANGMERRGFRFGARGVGWRRLSSRRLRVCSLSCRGLRR